MNANHVLPIVLLGLVACDDATAVETTESAAVSFEDHECDACGMIVRDQPAPRGQLIHRDGTRAFFCAISDLATYVSAPSPHGAPTSIFVEVLEADASPDDLSTDARPWHLAQETRFVVGEFQRPVMGRPVLTFATPEAGRAAAARLDGRDLDWAGLLSELDPHADPTN